jgi:hypothetical protein
MIRVVVYFIVLWACLLGATSSAWSEVAEERKPLKERWIPGFSGGLVLFEDKIDGSIDSTIGFSDSDSIGNTVPRLQLGLDLLSPTIPRLPFGLRVAGFGGVQFSGPNEENESAAAGEFVSVSKVEDQIAQASIPNPARPGVFPPPESFSNQGSSLTSERRNVGWFLGLGLSFEFPDRDDKDPALRLRPFVAYVGEQIDHQGQSLRVVGQPAGIPAVGEYTIEYESQSQLETYHYLGPGIDAELVLGSFEKTTVSFFARVSFLWNVGDSSATLNGPNGLGTYKVDVDDFRIRPGGGLRIAWRGGI